MEKQVNVAVHYVFQQLSQAHKISSLDDIFPDAPRMDKIHNHLLLHFLCCSSCLVEWPA